MTDTPAPTNVAITYYPGTWDPATAPRVGLATWILDGYYPYTNEPANLWPDDRAAAVQAAIWDFSDLYVLNPSDLLHEGWRRSSLAPLDP